MRHLYSIAFLLAASAYNLSVHAQTHSEEYNGAVVDAACKMGYTYRDVEAVFSALYTTADEVYDNASGLNKKAVQFSSSSAEVVAAKASALSAYTRAVEATSSLNNWRRDIKKFSDKVNNDFKKYFYRDGDSGFKNMFEICHKYKDEIKHLSRTLEDLEKSQNVQNWGEEQKKKLEEISGEITPKLLNDHQRNDEFQLLDKDFREFIRDTKNHITTVTFRLANAQSQLIEAQKTATVAAVKVVNEKVSECKGILVANEGSAGRSDEKEKCVQLQAKVEKIQSKIKQEGGSAPRSSTDAPLEPTARDSTATNKPEAVLKTGDGGDVVVSEESDSELIDLAVEASGQPSNMKSGGMTTTNLVLAIAIPAVVLCAGVMAFVVMQRNSHAKKVVAAV
ncbi:hypothetical protein ERJ75_000490100 [Trypanosoma vivax]|uniref:Uncharacterized protein n=1 Tax=Trypanosoma vivax (strain Y486) TaxID=1055687 RepID=F9WUY2_TRYVY|nr:hypothetical protein ERJ75_000490100 [Trypanosoma vivax]CCD21382.1 hypothetical protein, conserved in T. vivax [Trypanosoma vivax Y486]|eukprot:CCD21382.1 hypothetical protein, conserved in T. vivax [Trypanosoma vivax Y486]